MSRFFDDKVLSDDQICEETCENGQVSPESRYNDYRNRLPFHYIEDGENDGYYYWTYGATMELSIILSDDVACGEDPHPAYDIFVDDKLSETSKNPVQNKVITEALNGKVDKSTEKTVFDQAYIKTAAGDNSRRDISIEQLPLTLVERDIQGHVMTSKADSEGQAVPYEQLEQRVPAGGKEGQNLTKKSDKDYDVYWADPDGINSIEHITLNGEEVPVENKTAKITVDKSTVGLENIYAQLNENIIKNPEKTYLIWKGNQFPNTPRKTESGQLLYSYFKAPAGSTIDWGDGNVQTFETADKEITRYEYTDGVEYHLITITGLTSIPAEAFNYCTALVGISLANTITSIGSYALSDVGIASIFIPSSVTYLSQGALSHNEELVKVTIEGSVVIETQALNDCKKLQKVYILSHVPSKESIGLASVPKIVVPKGAADIYKNNIIWSKYADKIVYEIDSSDLDKAITDLDKDNIAYLNKENLFTTRQMWIKAKNPYLMLGFNSSLQSTLGESVLDFSYYNNGEETTTDYHRDYIYHSYNNYNTDEYTEAKLGFPTKSGTLALIEDLTAKLDKPTVSDSNYKIVTYNGTNSGTLDYSNAPNASSIMQRDADGRAQVVSGVSGNDIVNYSQLDTKYDKTGGTIGGNVVITGDLTVNGTQHINNTENLNVENAMIYSNANGATLATNGGIGIKKNATDVYGIVYDPTSDSVKLGLGKSDANGVFTFNENEGQPVAIRDDSSKFNANHFIKWNEEQKKLVDSGYLAEDFVDVATQQSIGGIKTFTDEVHFSTTHFSKDLNVDNAILKIFDNQKDLVTQYKSDSIVIENGTGSSAVQYVLTLPKETGTLLLNKFKYSTFGSSNDGDSWNLIDGTKNLEIKYQDVNSHSSIFLEKDYIELSDINGTGSAKISLASNVVTIDTVDSSDKHKIIRVNPDKVSIGNSTDTPLVEIDSLSAKFNNRPQVKDNGNYVDVALKSDLDNYVPTQSESVDKYYAQITNENGIISARIFQNGGDDVQNLTIDKNGVKVLGKNIATTDSLDTKVNKLAESLRNQAYVRDNDGNDTGLAYTYTDEGNTLAVRNASGQLQVSAPSQDLDAANKKFVIDEIANSQDVITDTEIDALFA